VKNWLTAYTFSNIHISLSAFCYALTTAFVIGEIPPFSLMLIIFSGTLLAYMFHRMYPIWANHTIAESNHILNWTKKNKSALNVLFSFALVISLISFAPLYGSIKLLLVVLAFINIAYSIPFVNYKGSKKALRDWPFSKLILIAFTWAVVCALLPALAIGNVSIQTIMALTLEKFFFIIAITIPFDIKDIAFDDYDNIATLPSRYGNDIAIIIALFSLILSLFFFLIFIESSISTKLVYFLFYGITAGLLFKSRNIQQEQFYLFGLDGLMILLFFMLIVLA